MTKTRRIQVLAYTSFDTYEAGNGCDVEMEFDTLKEARVNAMYYLSEAYRVVSEASERLGYSRVLLNGECVNDYFDQMK
ncbi:MAG: hypothetical protein WAN50_00150 [Minisyncoccia bacterium]